MVDTSFCDLCRDAVPVDGNSRAFRGGLGSQSRFGVSVKIVDVGVNILTSTLPM